MKSTPIISEFIEEPVIRIQHSVVANKINTPIVTEYIEEPVIRIQPTVVANEINSKSNRIHWRASHNTTLNSYKWNQLEK